MKHSRFFFIPILLIAGSALVFCQEYINVELGSGYKHDLVSNIDQITFSGSEVTFSLTGGGGISNVTDAEAWSDLKNGAYCAYMDGETDESATYGYLYNWYAVTNMGNYTEEGWHVPTDDEWKELEMYLGMSQSAADGEGYRGTD